MKTNKYFSYCKTSITAILITMSLPVFAEGFSLGSVDEGLSAAQKASETTQQAVAVKKQAEQVTAVQGGLTESLVNKLGVSSTQAQGGAGAIFKAAQGQLDANQFATLSKSVPEMDTLLSAAPKQATGLAGLAGASSMLGDSGSSLGNLAGLASSFSSLGLSADMVEQFVPIVTDYVQQKGGDMTANMLQSALLGN